MNRPPSSSSQVVWRHSDEGRLKRASRRGFCPACRASFLVVAVGSQRGNRPPRTDAGSGAVATERATHRRPGRAPRAQCGAIRSKALTARGGIWPRGAVEGVDAGTWAANYRAALRCRISNRRCKLARPRSAPSPARVVPATPIITTPAGGLLGGSRRRLCPTCRIFRRHAVSGAGDDGVAPRLGAAEAGYGRRRRGDGTPKRRGARRGTGAPPAAVR